MHFPVPAYPSIYNNIHWGDYYRAIDLPPTGFLHPPTHTPVMFGNIFKYLSYNNIITSGGGEVLVTYPYEWGEGM